MAKHSMNHKPETIAKKPDSVQKNSNILTRFFSHNITLLVLSFILAFTIWFVIKANSQTDSNVTISGIPVTVELSESAEEDGLEVFVGNDFTASVEVSGNYVTVGSLTSGDISVTASTGAIISPGTYTLPLSARKSGIKNNYEIVSAVSPSTITVYVDKRKNVEFPIENRLTVQLEDSKHYASTTLSQNNVNVSGPESQVKQIESVVVVDSITAGSDETKTVAEKLKYIDSDGNELDLPLVTADFDEVEATITVLPIMSVGLTVETVGAPKNAPPVVINPDTVKIAGSQSVLDTIRYAKISIGTLDYSKLKNEKKLMTYEISPPAGCKVISGEASSTVTVDLSSYSRTSISCGITSKIDTTKYSVDFNTSSIVIEVCGPESLLNTITESKISVVADFTDLLDNVTGNNAVSLSVPLTVTVLSDYAECWVYGSYTASVNITKK